MATFIKYITGMLPPSSSSNSGIHQTLEQATRTVSPEGTPSGFLSTTPKEGEASRSVNSAPASAQRSIVSQSSDVSAPPSPQPNAAAHPHGRTASLAGSQQQQPQRRSARRALSASVTRAASGFLRRHHTTAGSSSSRTPDGEKHGRDSTNSTDVGGSRFREKSSGPEGARYAGEAAVYEHGLVSDCSESLRPPQSHVCAQDTMIRERISTRGVVRPLEPESELTAFQLPPELVGEVSELAVRRYLDGAAKFGRKFAKATKAIEKARRRNLERAKRDTMRNIAQLHTFLNSGRSGDHGEGSQHGQGDGSHAASQDGHAEGSSARAVKADTAQGVKEGLAASGSWPWAWALDADENPPPSSIVSRRDTDEARRLAKIADQAVLMDEHAVSGNNLWSLIVNFLTMTPERDAGKHKHKHKHEHEDRHRGGDAEKHGHDGHSEGDKRSKRERFVSKFAKLVADHRKSEGSKATHSRAEQ